LPPLKACDQNPLKKDHDYQKSDNNFGKIDPGFAESARCIFVYKNHLGPHSARTRESTRNSAFLSYQRQSNSLMMARKKAKDQNSLLTFVVCARVGESVYSRLNSFIGNSDCHSIGEVARRILSREKILCLHRDTTMDPVVEELASIIKELNAIGVNINQVVHHFHIAENAEQRMFQALKVARQYDKVGEKVERLLEMVSGISKKWLQR
jgi:hypothetical protein